MRALVSLSIVGLMGWLALSGCGTGEASTASRVITGDQVRSSKPHSPPPIEQISTQAAAGKDTGGFTFAPPLDLNPSLSGEEAVARAWEYYVGANKPSSVSAVLENVTWTAGDLRSLDGRDVWVVTYPDACGFVFGPYRPGSEPSGCVVSSFSTIIDADTGKLFVSFTPGSR